jgi:hypothetical protein
MARPLSSLRPKAKQFSRFGATGIAAIASTRDRLGGADAHQP